MSTDDSTIGRRSVLSAFAAGLSGAAGCSSLAGESTDRSLTVSMLTAGSLNNAVENGLGPTQDATVQIEAHGSAQVARLVAEDQKDPDIISIADIAFFDSPLQSEWFAEFATNSLVIAYNPDTEGGQRLADAGTENWYRPLLNSEIALGRTDPDLDPLGYRSLFMLELATSHYETDVNLREVIPSREQIYPETQLISQFETGSIDAAIAYRNMAVERGYEYIELPSEIDLSDPAYTDIYSTASYKLPSGKTVRGGVISYGSTMRHQSETVVDVFDAHISGQYLNEFGFVVPDAYPRFTGNAPDKVTN